MKRTFCGTVLLVLTCGSANAISFTPLGDLEGDGFDSTARGLSADGSVVVGIGNSEFGPQAFRWTGGVMTVVGGRQANGVSADGSVVVGTTSNAMDNAEAFRWTGGVLTGLGDLAGGSFSSAANAASADGSVVVGIGASASGQEAFRWTGGVMTGLGDLPGGPFSSIAYGASADGSVVVGRATVASCIAEESDCRAREAFIWTAGGGMERLFDVLLAGGATGLTGWTLEEARAISADGQWIAGFGKNSMSQTEAFLANISVVPLPTTVWLLATAVVALGGGRCMRWRRAA